MNLSISPVSLAPAVKACHFLEGVAAMLVGATIHAIDLASTRFFLERRS